MNILFDTIAFIRYSQDQLPRNILRLLQKSTTEVSVSMVTPWEIALKPALIKLGMSQEGFREGISVLGAKLMPINLEHTDQFSRLPYYHQDPFDRMIIAQALVANCPVVSSDQRFPLYAKHGLKVLWET